MTRAWRRGARRWGSHRSSRDAELVTLAVMQALVGVHLRDPLAASRPQASAVTCSRICRASPATTSGSGARAGLIQTLIRVLAADTAELDRRRLADRLDPGRVRPIPAHRQAFRPGRLGRLRLLRQPLPLLLGSAPAPGLHPRRAARSRSRSTNPKTDERDVARDLLETEPDLLARRAGQTLIADKGYASREFETFLDRPRRRDCCAPPTRTERHGPAPGSSNRSARSSSRSTTPSKANSTSNATAAAPTTASPPASLQRLLALTAAIWHNEHTRPTRPAIPHRLPRRVTPTRARSSTRCRGRGEPDDRPRSRLRGARRSTRTAPRTRRTPGAHGRTRG